MKTIAKTILFGSMTLALLVGCHKDNVVPITPGGDSDTVSDTVIEVQTFDTIPANIDGFDIRGRWLWASPDSPNRLLMTFRDDSIVVFESFVYDDQNEYVGILDEIDSAKYRTRYSDDPLWGNRVYFYHRWMKNGTIYKPEFSIYSAIAYEPSVFDNQETMYLQYLGYVYEDIHPWIESFYVVRY